MFIVIPKMKANKKKQIIPGKQFLWLNLIQFAIANCTKITKAIHDQMGGANKIYINKLNQVPVHSYTNTSLCGTS